MRAPSPRRFTLLDVMVLVAATVVGLALDRVTLANVPVFASRGSMAILHVLLALLPILAMWTLAILALRLRPPRPRFRRLVRQPGFVACGAASLALLLCWGSGLLLLSRGSPFSMTRWAFVGYTPQFCFIVVGAWLTLAVGGRWRAEPHWIDRMGRGIGVLWIAADLLNLLRLVLF